MLKLTRKYIKIIMFIYRSLVMVLKIFIWKICVKEQNILKYVDSNFN